MQYTIKQLYDRLHQNLDAIQEVFNNFFGEERVDLQPGDPLNTEESITRDIQRYFQRHGILKDDKGCYELDDDAMKNLELYCAGYKSIIYVWWPLVTVSNENNKSVNIQDLYAQIIVQFDGRMPYEVPGFKLNRATYTEEQFLSNYMHSHISSIPKYNLKDFQSPCLGTGPIKGTINTLKMEFSEVSWMLFCQELSLYVTVESLSGGPYKRLEQIGSINKLYRYSEYSLNDSYPSLFTAIFPSSLKDFVSYYLQHGHLSISYVNNRYTVGMPCYDFLVDISNSFIDFYNSVLSKSVKDSKSAIDKCYKNELLVRLIASNGGFYSCDNGGNDSMLISQYQNRPVLTFKGKEIHLEIRKGGGKTEGTLTTVLDYKVAMFILHGILTTINYRYNYAFNDKTDRDKATSPACGSVLYL